MKVDVALLLFALSNFLEIMRNHTRLNTPRKQSIVSRVIRAQLVRDNRIYLIISGIISGNLVQSSTTFEEGKSRGRKGIQTRATLLREITGNDLSFILCILQARCSIGLLRTSRVNCVCYSFISVSLYTIVSYKMVVKAIQPLPFTLSIFSAASRRFHRLYAKLIALCVSF